MWWKKYEEESYSINKANNLNDKSLKGIINKNAKSEDITKEEGQVNVYFLEGKQMPNHLEEFGWSESIKKNMATFSKGLEVKVKKVMLNTMKEYKDKSFDVYIDKIKK